MTDLAWFWQERLLAEHEASASAESSKLKAAAAEKRATEARAEGLERELAACEGRLEESTRLLASNQQVIKWLNKELNDAQMVPGVPSTPNAAAIGGVGASGTVYGGVSSALGEGFGVYNFEGAASAGGLGSAGRNPTTPGGGGRDAMFTAGLRESLAGDGFRNLRGTTLDVGEDADDAYQYISYRDQSAGDGAANRGAEATPDHAGRGGEGYPSGRVGGGYGAHIVTPESAGVTNPVQASSGLRFKEGDGEKHVAYEDEGDDIPGRIGGGSIRGIPAF